MQTSSFAHLDATPYHHQMETQQQQQHRSVPITSGEHRPGQAQQSADATMPNKQQAMGFASASPATAGAPHPSQSYQAGTQPSGAQQQQQQQRQQAQPGQTQMPQEFSGGQRLTQDQHQGAEVGQKPGQVEGSADQEFAGRAGQPARAQPPQSAQHKPEEHHRTESGAGAEAPKSQAHRTAKGRDDSKSEDEKLIVITGASSGIGAAIAKEFSKAGYPLLLLARRKEEMEAHGLPNCMCESVDVRDCESFCNAVRKAEQRYGPTCCLINDAAVCYMGDMAEQDPSEWTSMITTNILGFMHGVQVVLKDMKERECGTIINITSVTAHKQLPNFGAYTATKAAVLAMMDNIREQVACCGVRIMCISPGVVDTGLVYRTTKQELKDQFDEMVEKDLKNEMLQPEDVAKACLFAYQQPKHVTIRELIIAPTHEQK